MRYERHLQGVAVPAEVIRTYEDLSNEAGPVYQAALKGEPEPSEGFYSSPNLVPRKQMSTLVSALLVNWLKNRRPGARFLFFVMQGLVVLEDQGLASFTKRVFEFERKWVFEFVRRRFPPR